MKPRPPLLVEMPTLLMRMETARSVAIEIRAAELVLLDQEGRTDEMTDVEFDWMAHGDHPPHAEERWPETDEEQAAYLASEIVFDMWNRDEEQS